MKGHVEVGILTDEDRRLYGALADILIPHAEGMPSAWGMRMSASAP